MPETTWRVPWLEDSGKPDLPEGADWVCPGVVPPPAGEKVLTRVYCDEATLAALRAAAVAEPEQYVEE